MTSLSELDTTPRNLFMELNRATQGNPQAQVSMYAIGEAIGLDRDASTLAAEDLMAHGFVEIRTLSGDIGLSEAGAALLTDDQETPSGGPRLGTEPALDASRREQVEQVLTCIKSELSRSGLIFAALAEMMADIHTIEAQLTSPQPKTAILRACFTSMLNTAGNNRQQEWQRLLEAFLG